MNFKTLLRFSLIASIFFAISTSAFAAEDFSKMSPTVRITSYIYTKNNDVVAQVQGSATIINSSGLILSNNHVVERDQEKTYDAFEICFSFETEKEPICEYTAHLIARNREMDASLLQIDPIDIHGKALPALQWLDYHQTKELKEGDPIAIWGFPGIGLDTITLTKGQISGFEEINGFTYVKTDTTIAPGNSGGTALDAAGNFLGIPTYGQATFGSSLGYFLDLRDALTWLDVHKSDSPIVAPGAREKLIAQLVQKESAKTTGKYVRPFPPEFSLEIPKDWEFAAIERYGVLVHSKNEIANYQVNIALQDAPFEFTPEYLQKSVFEKLEKNKEQYNNYERVNTEFHGVPAYRVSYIEGDIKTTHLVVPYGSTLFFISYDTDLKKEDEATKAYDTVLQSFQFVTPPKVQPAPETLTRINPAFAVSTVPDWYLLENQDPNNEDLIAQFLRPDNIEGEISISHFELSETDKELSAKDLLRKFIDDLESINNFRIVSSSEAVVIDGLKGISLTYTYEGEDFGKARQASRIFLRDGENGYFIEYDDLDKNYDKYLPDFLKILNSFQNKDPKASGKGKYEIGSLTAIFRDVNYHRYEQAIAKLKDEGILEGYKDNTFRPENSVSRIEALKMVFTSKLKLEEKQGKTDLEQALEASADYEVHFSDTKDLGAMEQYLRLAQKKEIASGYVDGTFHPSSSVTLAEFLKILLKAYEIPVWQSLSASTESSWYKPYLDKGFELGLIPYGLYDPEHSVTRGEVAAILSSLLEQMENHGFGF